MIAWRIIQALPGIVLMRTGSPDNPGTASPQAVAAAMAARARAVSRLGSLTAGRVEPQADPTPSRASSLPVDRRRKHPKLRLVGVETGSVVKPAITPQQHDPITDTADPRWVLAVRTAEQLEGTILRPEKREHLLKLGKVFGLTPFDANLVIAIVQDQARRGHAPAYCPTAGEPQLRMVPPPRRRPWSLRRWLTLGACIATFTAAELAVLAWYFGG